MARTPPRLTVFVSRRAQRDLDHIWDYNVDFYNSADHADAYLAFLEDETAKLQTNYHLGRPVPQRIGLQHITIRKGRGHGYVVIYEVSNETLQILRYFHTRQDWQGKTEKNDV